MKSLAVVLVMLATLLTASPGQAAPDRKPVPDDATTRTLGADTSQPIPGEYIAALRPGVDITDLVGADAVVDEFDSFYLLTLGRAEADDLADDPAVVSLTNNKRVVTAVEQAGAPTGLDRVDQRDLALDGRYQHDNYGAGVDVYVVDSGINGAHTDFAGRIANGYDAVDGGAPDDCAGHGTHVAGTVGGTTFGIAKQATIVPVRVMDCAGFGTTFTMLDGLDWIAQRHDSEAAVVNMSVGGVADTLVDAAVNDLINEGITVVVAAGNDADLACSYSPARVPAAITVAASDPASDTEPWWSNWGECVDLYAPGVDIVSAGMGRSDSVVASGTSMASPHVAGAAATYLADHPDASPTQVASALLGSASRNRIDEAWSNNVLLHVAYTQAAPDLDPALDSLVPRLSGDDRIATAVAVSRELWESANTVILARADAFPDALAAGPLAGFADAPIMLTSSGSLDGRVADEIARLGAQRVYLVGGTSALGRPVEQAVAGLAQPVRLAGTNRYKTADAIADEIAEFRDTGLAFSVGAVVNGATFPDALAAMNLTGYEGDGSDIGPDYIWLTPRETLPGDDRVCHASYPDFCIEPPPPSVDCDELGLMPSSATGVGFAVTGDDPHGFDPDDDGIGCEQWSPFPAEEFFTIVGGEAAVSGNVERQLGYGAETVDRVAGGNRYETAAEALNVSLRERQGARGPLFVATGAAFPDALAGGAALAQTGGYLALVAPDSVPEALATVLQDHVDAFTTVYVLGGEQAVTGQVQQTLADLLRIN